MTASESLAVTRVLEEQVRGLLSRDFLEQIAAKIIEAIDEARQDHPPDMVVVGYCNAGGESKPIYQQQTIRPVSPWFEQNGMTCGTGWDGVNPIK